VKRFLKKRVLVKSAIGFVTLALFACENSIETVNLVSQKDELPAMSAYDMSILYTDSTYILLNLKAEEIQTYSNKEKPYTEFPQGIEVVYFTQYPDTNSMITANYAIRYDDKKYWEAKGNVVAKNTKGEVLNTEYMIWDEEKEIIYSDQYVKIITAEDIIEGVGFEADQSFTSWKITKVTGFINVDDAE